MSCKNIKGVELAERMGVLFSLPQYAEMEEKLLLELSQVEKQLEVVVSGLDGNVGGLSCVIRIPGKEDQILVRGHSSVSPFANMTPEQRQEQLDIKGYWVGLTPVSKRRNLWSACDKKYFLSYSEYNARTAS